MKQSIYKQLLMLAVMLFAGIGSAFADKTISIQMDYPETLSGGDVQINSVPSGTGGGVNYSGPIELQEGLTYQMVITPNNEYGGIGSVTVDGTDVTTTYNANGYYEFVNLSDDHVVVITFIDLRPKVTVKCNYPLIIGIGIDNLTNGGWYNSSADNTLVLDEGCDYRMWIYNNNPDVYTVTSIMVGNEDRINDYNQNGYFDITNLTTDLTININLTKSANAKTVTLYRDNTLVGYYLESSDYGYWEWVGETKSDESKTEWDLLKGKDYKMSINPQQPLTSKITSVIMDEKDVTSEFNSKGYLEFPQLAADHVVTVVADKIGETKNITVEGLDWGKGYVRFYDPAKHISLGAYAETTELLVGSTTQMYITTRQGWKVKKLTVDESDVTEAYKTNGYYEFKNLADDHAVSVEFEEAQMFTITPTFTKGWMQLSWNENQDDTWPGSGDAVQLNEGWNVKMRCPAIWEEWNSETGQYDYFNVTVKIDGATVALEKNEDDEYEYMFNNLSANHTIELVYDKAPTIRVNGYGDVSVTLNDVECYTGNIYPYAMGTNVKMVLGLRREGQKIVSIKIGDDDITDAYNENGYYIFENLTEDIVVDVTMEDVETWGINARFDAKSQGVAYFISSETGRKYEAGNDNWWGFAAGSNVTLSIKTPIGYEVASILLNDYEEVNAVYNENTKEYEYVFENLTQQYDAVIYTQKKAYPAGLEYVPYTLYDLGDGTGEGTFCSEYDLDFKDVEGITAYIASGFNPNNGNIVLTIVWDVPRGTGVMIRGISGEYQIPVTTSDYYFKNLLVGIADDLDPLPVTEEVDGIEHTNFTLKKVTTGEARALFYKSTGQKLEGHKAYLQLPTYMVPEDVSGTRGIGYEFDDDATSLKDLMIFEDTESGDYYNLQGQKVQNPSKGIYIKNGKKVIIR